MTQHGDVDDSIDPALAEMARAGRGHSEVDYVAALEKIRGAEPAFDALFERADMLLTPTTAAMPWPARLTHPETIAGKPVGARGHAVLTPFANALGLPAISLPCEAWHDAMPIGFQLCAARGHDRALLEFARLYEASATWRSRWPDV
jgi:aspartyl-tRNA(Asn)/glutamyl-tRNA(Gln) amidotransferase subunit A